MSCDMGELCGEIKHLRRHQRGFLPQVPRRMSIQTLADAIQRNVPNRARIQEGPSPRNVVANEPAPMISTTPATTLSHRTHRGSDCVSNARSETATAKTPRNKPDMVVMPSHNPFNARTVSGEEPRAGSRIVNVTGLKTRQSG